MNGQFRFDELTVAAEKGSAVEDLHSLLTWRHGPELLDQCDALRARYQGSIALALSMALARIGHDSSESASRCGQLRARLEALDPTCLGRILAAPETCFQLVLRRDQDTAQLADFLDDAIELERTRSDQPTRRERPAWSVMGDRYVPGSTLVEANVERFGWLNDLDRPYEALTWGDIVVDFFSPYAARPLDQNNFRPDFAPPRPYSEGDAKIVGGRVIEALNALERVGGVPLDFVKVMIRTLMPRPDAVSALFSGGSNRGHMGRVNLFNPHLDYISHHNIANSLVHESIHMILYLIEQRERPVMDHGVLYNEFIESPWSDRRIHLLAYIHASFVWYGLYHFWSLPEVEREMEGVVRQHYLAFSVRGFAGNQMIERLSRFRSHIRPDLMEQLAALQQTMSNL